MNLVGLSQKGGIYAVRTGTKCFYLPSAVPQPVMDKPDRKGAGNEGIFLRHA